MDNETVNNTAPAIAGILTPFLVQLLRSKAIPIHGFWALLLTLAMSALTVAAMQLAVDPAYTMQKFIASFPQCFVITSLVYRGLDAQLKEAMPVKGDAPSPIAESKDVTPPTDTPRADVEPLPGEPIGE